MSTSRWLRGNHVAQQNPARSPAWLCAAGRGRLTSAIVAAGQLRIDRTPFDVPDRGTIKGSPSARFVIVEFSDYACPFCAKHATGAFRQIDEEFVQTGRIQYVFLNFPLDRTRALSLHAAHAAECAGRHARFWQMHDRLFQNPGMFAEPDLLEHAAALELPSKAFKECLSGGATDAVIREDGVLAARLSVRGTPTFVFGEIDNRRVHPHQKLTGAAPFSVLKGAIEDLLEER